MWSSTVNSVKWWIQRTSGIIKIPHKSIGMLKESHFINSELHKRRINVYEWNQKRKKKLSTVVMNDLDRIKSGPWIKWKTQNTRINHEKKIRQKTRWTEPGFRCESVHWWILFKHSMIPLDMRFVLRQTQHTNTHNCC